MDILTPFRSALNLQMVMPVARIRALVMSASAEKVALAETMIKNLDK